MSRIILPGAMGSRQGRGTRLELGWRASECTMQPYTGQGPLFSYSSSGTRGVIRGLNGATVTAGHGQMRFDVDTAFDLVTRLAIDQSTAGQDVETFSIAFAAKAIARSILVRVRPSYTAGASVSPDKMLLAVGNGTTGAGYWTIARSGTGWATTRKRGATTLVATVTEPGTTTYPMDVLATLSLAGVLQISIRSAAGVITAGATQTNAVMGNATEAYTGGHLFIGGTLLDAILGGKFYIEYVKVARGVRTFADMDTLT